MSAATDFWIYDDGGRADAGFKGDTGDCVCRAIAIVTGTDYRTVYDMIVAAGKAENPKRKFRCGCGKTVTATTHEPDDQGRFRVRKHKKPDGTACMVVWCKPTKPRFTRSHARTGVSKMTTRQIMDALGFKWTPTMAIGSGCTVHLRADELPPGKIICNLSGHVCAVIDGVVHDLYDPSRDGTRCVYGYWTKP